MKLQDQVCTISQAERLKELGVIQSSTFYWVKHKQTAFSEPSVYYCGDVQNHKEEFGEGCFGITVVASAFTVDELGSMLPASIQFVKKRATLRIVKCEACDEYNQPDSYIVGYYTSEKELLKDWVMGNGHYNLANAAAGMLIMLIEHNKTKVDEVNARLCADQP